MWKINRQLRILSSIVIAAFITGATSLHAQRLSRRLKSDGLNFSISGSPVKVLTGLALACVEGLRAAIASTEKAAFP